MCSALAFSGYMKNFMNFLALHGEEVKYSSSGLETATHSLIKYK
jgi:hypothetical protein